MGFKFIYIKNIKERVKAVCSSKFESGCNWVVCASLCKVNGSFYVKEFVSNHDCGVGFADVGAKRLSCSNIADIVVDQIRVNPCMKSKDIVNMFRTNYGFGLPMKKAWRALEKAKGMLYGDAIESFKLLRWYTKAVLDNNPGSHIVLDVEHESRRFRRLFLSFRASTCGFKFYRPLLFLDGTFLKERCKCVILSAIGKDGNQGLYPIAFVVVDSETQEKWHWFLSKLGKVIDDGRIVNFVSDRSIGLLDALAQVFHGHNHFFCLQHLKANLRDKFRSSSFSNSYREHIVWLFQECAHAPTEANFFSKLAELKRCGEAIVDRFLEGLPFPNWTNAFSKGCRYGEMSSNAAESFNAWLLEVRDLPITHMVDSISIKLMNWFSERRKTAIGWNGCLCPKMFVKLNTFVVEGRTWIVRKSCDTIFEVFSVPSVIVDIGKKSCSCHMWELSGFPCVHATVAIFRYSCSIVDLVDQCFHVESYRRSYEDFIYPVPSFLLSDHVCSEDDAVLAPSTRRQPGRPRKSRFRSAGEVVRRIKCGRCGKIDHHNRKTCKEPLL